MTTDKFSRRNQAISLNMARIAAWRESNHSKDFLKPADPQYRAVLQAQEHLLNVTERLLEHITLRIAA